MSETIIGPNVCPLCGGEYGEHDPDCSSLAPAPGSQAETPALLLCPFCGGVPVRVFTGLRRWVECGGCGARSKDSNYTGVYARPQSVARQESDDAWNRRVPKPENNEHVGRA